MIISFATVPKDEVISGILLISKGTIQVKAIWFPFVSNKTYSMASCIWLEGLIPASLKPALAEILGVYFH